MTVLTRILILYILISTGMAFQIINNEKRIPNSRLQAKSKKSPQIDERKIKDAATHFGKYSLKEIEEMKNKLHQERVHSLVFDNISTVSTEKAAEQRLWEEELDLQINLLKKENENDAHGRELFPYMEDSMQELPHLEDAKVKERQNVFMLEETLLEENVLETIAFCTVLAFLMIVPNLL